MPRNRKRRRSQNVDLTLLGKLAVLGVSGAILATPVILLGDAVMRPSAVADGNPCPAGPQDSKCEQDSAHGGGSGGAHGGGGGGYVGHGYTGTGGGSGGWSDEAQRATGASSERGTIRLGSPSISEPSVRGGFGRIGGFGAGHGVGG